MPSYVKFEMPKELIPQVLEMLSMVKDGGKVRKGVNETTKSIERKAAQFVILAEDVQPEEIVVHIPMLCEEKGIAYGYVPTKKDLGKAVGIPVGTSSIAIESSGGAAETLQDIIRKLPKKPAAAMAAATPPKPAAKPAVKHTEAAAAKKEKHK